MKRAYSKEVQIALERTKQFQEEILTQKDLEHLPFLVQKYLHYVD